MRTQASKDTEGGVISFPSIRSRDVLWCAQKRAHPTHLVSWSQADYFRIAKTLQQEVWFEPLESQNLYHVAFKMKCSNIEQGSFSEAIFLFFKEINKGEEESRVQYYVRIVPADSLVDTSKAEFSPNLYVKKPINLAQYRITAEEALRIAEENGGAEKRLEFEDACQIDVLAPGSDSKGWRVLYLNINNKIESFFEIAIDSQTGVFRVLYPKP